MTEDEMAGWPGCGFRQITLASMYFGFLSSKAWMITAALCPLPGCCDEWAPGCLRLLGRHNSASRAHGVDLGNPPVVSSYPLWPWGTCSFRQTVTATKTARGQKS